MYGPVDTILRPHKHQAGQCNANRRVKYPCIQYLLSPHMEQHSWYQGPILADLMADLVPV